MLRPSLDAGAPRRHAVQFYGDDDRFFRDVADFLLEGMTAGQAAVAIATEPHCRAIEQQLGRRGVDCKQAHRDGSLRVLDATRTLSGLLVGGELNTALFERDVATVMADIEAVRGPGVIRAYGEMVNVLWRHGRFESALHLESLWNRPPFRNSFDLLCGYPLQDVQDEPALFQAICDVHTHVSKTGNVLPFPRKGRSKTA
jgi:hypothetical protein